VKQHLDIVRTETEFSDINGKKSWKVKIYSGE